MIMRALLGLTALALAATTTIATAETAKRRVASYQTTSASSNTDASRTIRSTSAYDADPSRRNGNYPDWALLAFAGRGTSK
jgi:hypothetical protein